MRAAWLAVSGVLLLSNPALAQSLGELAPREPAPSTTVTRVACTDQPTSLDSLPSLRVLAGQVGDDREAFATGDVLVLNGNTASRIEPGQRYLVRRLAPPRVTLGNEDAPVMAAHTAGWISVTAADQHFALARVDYACDTVMVGDYLEALALPVPAEASAAGEPAYTTPARVLFGVDRKEAFGAGDVFAINRGTGQGVQAGTRVIVYRDRRSGTPLVELAEGHVVDVSTDSARVVLTRARDAVYAGDLVVLR